MNNCSHCSRDVNKIESWHCVDCKSFAFCKDACMQTVNSSVHTHGVCASIQDNDRERLMAHLVVQDLVGEELAAHCLHAGVSTADIVDFIQHYSNIENKFTDWLRRKKQGLQTKGYNAGRKGYSKGGDYYAKKREKLAKKKQKAEKERAKNEERKKKMVYAQDDFKREQKRFRRERQAYKKELQGLRRTKKEKPPSKADILAERRALERARAEGVLDVDAAVNAYYNELF